MIDQMIDKYIALRDKKAELEAAHKLAVAPVNDAMAKVEAYLLNEMSAQGTTAFTVKGVGTAYQATKTSVRLADWDSLRPFLEQQPDPYRFLDRKVNKTAVDEYVAEFRDLPPGVDYRSEISVNIRRA